MCGKCHGTNIKEVFMDFSLKHENFKEKVTFYLSFLKRELRNRKKNIQNFSSHFQILERVGTWMKFFLCV